VEKKLLTISTEFITFQIAKKNNQAEQLLKGD
jgi:hypothetical protein